MSSIFESLLRNSISIFGFGGFDEDHNTGAGKSTMKRTIKKSAAPAVKNQYGSVNTTDNVEDESMEM